MQIKTDTIVIILFVLSFVRAFLFKDKNNLAVIIFVFHSHNFPVTTRKTICKSLLHIISCAKDN